MNIRQLQYFISVAEHLNFSKAAKEHYIAQPAISQQIAMLEQELGFKLFDRTSRSVKLTSAGEMFYNEVVVITKRLDHAIMMSKSIANGASGSISIGFQGLHEMKILPGMINRFCKANPDVEVDLHQDLIDQLEKSLTNGLVDIVFTLAYGILDNKKINTLPVIKSKWCAVMNIMHPLAFRHSVTRMELCEENYICIDPRMDPGIVNHILQTCLDTGFAPRIVSYTKSFEETFLMIEAGMGIWFFPQCCNRFNKNIRFVELEGEDEEVDIVMQWRKDNENPSVKLFVKEVEEMVLNQNAITETGTV